MYSLAGNTMLSVPKKFDSTPAAAALKVLCADTYSGKAGAVTSETQFVSCTVAGLPSVSASRMAAMGRHRL